MVSARMTKIFLVVFLLSIVVIHVSNGGMYPECWIKRGECLDNNVGPLIEAVTPQINHNIVKNATMDVDTLDDCAQQCFNDSDCRYLLFWKLTEFLCSIVYKMVYHRKTYFFIKQVFYILRERNSWSHEDNEQLFISWLES